MDVVAWLILLWPQMRIERRHTLLRRLRVLAVASQRTASRGQLVQAIETDLAAKWTLVESKRGLQLRRPAQVTGVRARWLSSLRKVEVATCIENHVRLRIRLQSTLACITSRDSIPFPKHVACDHLRWPPNTLAVCLGNSAPTRASALAGAGALERAASQRRPRAGRADADVAAAAAAPLAEPERTDPGPGHGGPGRCRRCGPRAGGLRLLECGAYPHGSKLCGVVALHAAAAGPGPEDEVSVRPRVWAPELHLRG